MNETMHVAIVTGNTVTSIIVVSSEVRINSDGRSLSWTPEPVDGEPLVPVIIDAGEGEHFAPCVDGPDGAPSIGWLLDKGELKPPPVMPPTREQLLDYAADLRWQRQSAGISVNGAHVRTDDETRAALASAMTVAQLDATFKTQWKFADGTFALLDKAKLGGLTLAVAAHVSAQFAWEKAVRAAIQSDAVTTFPAVADFTA